MSQTAPQPIVVNQNPMGGIDPQERFLNSLFDIQAKKNAEKETPAPVSEVKETPPTKPEVIVEDKKEEIVMPEEKVVVETKDTPVALDDFDEAKTMETLGLTPNVIENKPAETPASASEELEKYKQAAAKLDMILSNKQLKAIIEANENGETPFDVLRKIQGEDYSKLSAKELFELDLTKQGLSEDAKELDRVKFDGMLTTQQNQIANQIRQNLEAERNAGLEQYKSENQVDPKVVEAQNKLLEANYQKAHARISELKEQKKYMNLELTTDRWGKIHDVLMQLRPNENLDYDVDRAFKHAVWELYSNEIILANVRIATTKGREEALLNMTRPSLGNQNTNTPPPTTQSAENSQKKVTEGFLEERKAAYK